MILVNVDDDVGGGLGLVGVFGVGASVYWVLAWCGVECVPGVLVWCWSVVGCVPAVMLVMMKKSLVLCYFFLDKIGFLMYNRVMKKG